MDEEDKDENDEQEDRNDDDDDHFAEFCSRLHRFNLVAISEEIDANAI